MLAVTTEEAQPGMRLAVAVTHPEKPSHELLRPGFALTPEAIVQLQGMGIGFIYVDYPGLEDLDRYFAIHLSSARQQVYQHIKTALETVQRTTKLVARFSDYYNATRNLITELLSQTRQPCYMEMLSTGLGPDAVAHGTAVAQLALTLGIRLESYLIQQRTRLPAHQARDVVNLGVAGMLHDVGKTRLPPELQNHPSFMPLKDEDQRKIWESHPRLGYELIHDGVEVTAAAAVLHHHQHYDGSGFPQLDTDALAGEKVHIFARIILAADLYDRLSGGAGGRRLLAIEVLHRMQAKYAGWVDPEIYKSFAAVVPPFPPGSKVGLSDGSLAVVTAPNPADPYRPLVRRITADAGELGPPIPLSDDGAPAIVSINGLRLDQLTSAFPIAA